jgi:hypothetical protein
MKQLLMVFARYNDDHQKLCQAMQMEALKYDPKATLFHDTAILLSGHKSLEGLFALRDHAMKKNLPFSVFEIESALTPSDETTGIVQKQ